MTDSAQELTTRIDQLTQNSLELFKELETVREAYRQANGRLAMLSCRVLALLTLELVPDAAYLSLDWAVTGLQVDDIDPVYDANGGKIEVTDDQHWALTDDQRLAKAASNLNEGNETTWGLMIRPDSELELDLARVLRMTKNL